MSRDFAYDNAYDPPAPVIPMRITVPQSETAVMVSGLLDSGADCSLIPLRVAEELGLPRIGALEIARVGGGGGTAPLYAARVQIAGREMLVRLVAYESAVIIGRDILNRMVMLLHGPSGRFRVR